MTETKEISTTFSDTGKCTRHIIIVTVKEHGGEDTLQKNVEVLKVFVNSVQ